MGMYDTVWFKGKDGEEEGIQFKTRERICANYNVGDFITLCDGIHYGYEGAFVVVDKTIVAAFSSKEPFQFDKWGGVIDYPELD